MDKRLRILIIAMMIATLAIFPSLFSVNAETGYGKVHFDFDYKVTEGFEHSTNICVVREPGGSGPLTVNFYTSDGTGTAGVNYDATSGTVTWAAGESGRKLIPVNVRQIAAYDHCRDFHVTLSGDNVMSPSTTTVFILNYDNPYEKTQDYVHIHDPQTVFTNQSYVTITVDRKLDEALGYDPYNQHLAGECSVYVRTGYGGTAVSGIDYVEYAQTFFWGDGAGGPQTMQIPLIHNDISNEPDKTLFVEMIYDYGTSPTAIVHRYDTGSTSFVSAERYEGWQHIVVTLKEDLYTLSSPPGSPGMIGIVESTYSVDEGSNYQFYIERTGGSSTSVRMGVYTTGRSATDGADFVGINQEFEFPAGVEGVDSRKYISIPINADSVADDREVFTINLNKVSGGEITLGLRGLDISINDVPPGVSPSPTVTPSPTAVPSIPPVTTPTPVVTVTVTVTPAISPSPTTGTTSGSALPCCPSLLILPLLAAGTFLAGRIRRFDRK